MRKSGSKAKGSAFERIVCRDLSRWISDGQYEKLFNRNVLSGGRFSRAVKSNETELGLAGDIAAAHPLAYEFLTHCSVECKHYRQLGIEAYMFGAKTCLIASALKQAARDCAGAGTYPLVIVKANNRPTLLFLSNNLGAAIVRDSRNRMIPFHCFHSASIYAFEWEMFMKHVPIQRFLRLVKELQQ